MPGVHLDVQPLLALPAAPPSRSRALRYAASGGSHRSARGERSHTPTAGPVHLAGRYVARDGFASRFPAAGHRPAACWLPGSASIAGDRGSLPPLTRAAPPERPPGHPPSADLDPPHPAPTLRPS